MQQRHVISRAADLNTNVRLRSGSDQPSSASELHQGDVGGSVWHALSRNGSALLQLTSSYNALHRVRHRKWRAARVSAWMARDQLGLACSDGGFCRPRLAMCCSGPPWIRWLIRPQRHQRILQRASRGRYGRVPLSPRRLACHLDRTRLG